MHPQITIIEPSLNPKGTVKAAQKRSEMVGQIFKIDDVDPLVLQDFVALRKAHKAPLTATAVSDLRTQAAKAGLTLQQVMQEMDPKAFFIVQEGVHTGGNYRRHLN